MSRQRADRDPPPLDAASARVLRAAREAVKQRRSSEAEHEARQQRHWLWVALLLSVLAIGGVLLWPSGTVALRLHALMRGICDQQNNLAYASPPLPLDARCTGIYTSLLATLLYLLVLGRLRATDLPPLPISIALAGAIALMTIDGFNSALSQWAVNLYPTHNALRLATGLGMGLAIAMLGLPLLNGGLRARQPAQQRSVRSWRELAGALIPVTILGWMAWSAPGWLFYPLALFSVAGAIVALLAVNVGVVALFSGLGRRVLLVGQLARPLAFGVMLTAAELALLGWARDLSEQAAVVLRGWLL